ncbi:MAG: translation initiation factor IF-3 [Proteobacteria bacterium]|nr:translation initiation factor IF-3 [Pseudomonadota bacterium]
MFVFEDLNIAKKKQAKINDQVRSDPVRLIDEKGEQTGIVSLAQAQQRASDLSLDLVEISPNAEPPVCRIMDYGKQIFNERKKRQEAKKNQKQTTVKEIKFRPGTDVGDYAVKLRNLTKFLEDGNKTKVTMRFRGREMAHRELGLEMLERIRDDLEEISTVEARPLLEGRQMVMVLAPNKR